MDRVGVCGSDIHYYTDGKIGSQVVQYPFTVGHEGAGTVCEVGSGVLRIKPGDRVAIDPAMPCFGCDQCLSGRFHTCRKLLFLGCPGQAEGCLSDYIVMPEHSCFVLPATMSFDEAVVSEPLAIGYYATKLAGCLSGKSVGKLFHLRATKGGIDIGQAEIITDMVVSIFPAMWDFCGCCQMLG